MGEAVVIMFVGIIIVFIVLVGLVVLVNVMSTLIKKFINKPDNQISKDDLSSNQKNIVPVETTAKVDEMESIESTEEQPDDNQLIAVISAAISVMRQQEGNLNKFNITDIKKTETNNQRSAWGMAGLIKNTRPF